MKLDLDKILAESVPEEKIKDPNKCICHNCGYEQEPVDKINCADIICPDCGMPLWHRDDPANEKVRKYIKNAIRWLMMRDTE